jgi:hypothetical protein
VRIAPVSPSAEPLRLAAAMISSVIALYALTALVRGESGLVAVTIVYATAALICTGFARSGADLVCAALAAVFGVGTEAVMAAAGIFEYASDVPSLLGFATWLPALYLAYGVVAARLGGLLARAP